ncbi:MAG TPA: hypothetical protein VL359_19215 [bacterium]|nr:hypothetical protein [bacterium]
MKTHLCPFCDEPLVHLGRLFLCGWCGYRLGVAEPLISHSQVAEATARFLERGGRITRLPDGPARLPEEAPVADDEVLAVASGSPGRVG